MTQKFCLRNIRFTPFILAGLSAFLLSCNPDDDLETPVQSTFENDVASLSTLFLQSDEILSVSSDEEFFYINSTGLAGHKMMVGITSPNDFLPVPQYYGQWSIPLRPIYATNPVNLETELQSAPVALAINGLPIYNSVNLSSEFSGTFAELDEFGGHTGPSDEYHYHYPPLHLQIDDSSPIAFAFDGFPIYGEREPDGSEIQALDEFNGHEDEDGHFHYHVTVNEPVVFEKFRGEVLIETDNGSTKASNQPDPLLFRNTIYNYLTRYSDQIPVEITGMTENEDETGISINYSVDGQPGLVTYFWDESGFYTFTFSEPDGNEVTQVFMR